MDLLTYVAVISVAFSFLLSTCASDQVVNVGISVEQVHHHAKFRSAPSVPRKLKINEEAMITQVKTFADEDVMPHKKLMQASSGKKAHDQEQEMVMMHIAAAGKGTYREWIEKGPNRSEYFTMDYGWVKRRRPIHNKKIPLVP